VNRQIIEVKIIPSLIHIYHHRYAILLDREADEIIKFARENERVFVFPFITCKPEFIDILVPDYSSLFINNKEGSLENDYIVPPLYVGNYSKPSEIIQQYVDMCLCHEDARIESECVHSDLIK
jgi:hypothetical protein